MRIRQIRLNRAPAAQLFCFGDSTVQQPHQNWGRRWGHNDQERVSNPERFVLAPGDAHPQTVPLDFPELVW